MGGAMVKRFTANGDGTLWHYRGIANVFTQFGSRSVATELHMAVLDIEAIGWRSMARSADV